MGTKSFFQATSTKQDGNLSFLYDDTSQVVENRQKFLSKNNLLLTQGVALRTQHTTDIQVVDSSFKGKGMSDIETAIHADALITQESDLVLFLLTADCLPIIFFDEENSVIGIAHLSRENTSLKFTEKIVSFLNREFSTNLQNLRIWIGPGIHSRSYLKSDNIFENVNQEIRADWKPFLTPLANGKIAIDLVGYNVHQMINQGVHSENIDVSPIDTYTSDYYFSHRRSEVTGEKEGRFATIIGLLSR